MPDFPLPPHGFAGMQTLTNGPTSSAVAHTKGSWADIVASTAFDADGIILSSATLNGSFGHMLDVAVGAGGSEVIILENWLHATATQLGSSIFLPIALPAGSQIRARVAYGGGSAFAIRCAVTLVRGGLLGPPAGGKVVTLGADTTDTGGKVIDPGGTINTYGAWAEIVASTADDIVGLWPVIGNRGNTAPVSVEMGSFRFDIGVGAAASEQLVAGPIPFGSYTNALYSQPPALWLPVTIPAGSRISARGMSSTNNATDRLFDLVLYALTI